MLELCKFLSNNAAERGAYTVIFLSLCQEAQCRDYSISLIHFLQNKKPSPKSGIHLLDALITVEGKVAPHLVVQWGKEVLRPVVQGGMLPHPRGVQVGTVVLKKGMPQIFLQFKHKVRFQGPSSPRTMCIIYSAEKFCIYISFKDSRKLLNIHLDMKSIHCTY